MADVYGSYYTDALQTTPPEKVKSSLWGGKQRITYDTYEADGAAAGTDILIGRMNIEEVIHSFRVLHDALGTAVTLQLAIRDTTDATETVLSPATAAATAGIIEPVAADIARLPSSVSEEVDVILKVAAAAATGTIKTWIFSTVE